MRPCSRLPCAWAFVLACGAARPARTQPRPAPPAAPRPEQPRATHTVRATPLSADGPGITLDGRLDEPAWLAAAAAEGFVQREPTPGAAAQLRTEARVVYDGRTLFVAMRMHDPEPGAIRTQLTRRDDQASGSDWVSVELDTYFDRRTAFRFATNPAGSRVDVLLSEDTRSDVTWDAAWDVRTRVDSLGWTAEFAIPLSQLRYSTTGDPAGRRWGIQFMRESARLAEVSYWSPMPPQVNRYVSQFGTLEGLAELGATQRIELLPYAVARTTRAPGDPANPFYARARYAGNTGGDFKLGVRSNFTITGTINPDFGQVEQDPSVVNLGAFEVFFPERRPFFTEGAEIFRFALVPEGNVFYSRRVGRAPQRTAPRPAGGWVDAPETAPILGAVKLSGKTAGGWSVGLLHATTGEVDARVVDSAGRQWAEPVEPFAQYAVGRLARDFRRGRSSVGLIATTTQRRLDDDRLQQLRRAGSAAGVNWFHRFARDRYQVTGWLLGSDVRGSPPAMTTLQRNAVHRFQRPDAAHLTLDTTATSMQGWAGETYLTKIAGTWVFNVGGGARSPGIDVNEGGYQTYADVWYGYASGGYQRFLPGRRVRNWNTNVVLLQGFSFGQENMRREIDWNGGVTLTSLAGGTWSLQRWFPSYSTVELRGGPALRIPAHTDWNLSAYTNRRHRYVGEMRVTGTHQEETGRLRVTVAPAATLRPTPRASFTLQPRLDHNADPAQYLRTVTDAGTRRHLVGGLRQQTVSMVARAGYAITPTMSLDVYAQPFASVGRYATISEVVAPRAPRFVDRLDTYDAARMAFDDARGAYRVDRDRDGRVDFTLADPDFAVREFRSNTVLRWEYRPGSTLFLAWSQARDDATRDPALAVGRDARRLFGTVPRNVVLLKVSVWRPL